MAIEVANLEEKCSQAMMLKFGRVVDIDTLGKDQTLFFGTDDFK